MSDDLFQQLEAERSTPELLKKIQRRLGVSVDSNVVDAAMPHLISRHLLVHADGRIDEESACKFPSLGVAGEQVQTSYPAVTAAVQSIKALVREMDTAIVAAGLLDSAFLQGGSIGE